MDMVVGGKSKLTRGLYLFFGFWFQVSGLDLGYGGLVRIEKN